MLTRLATIAAIVAVFFVSIQAVEAAKITNDGETIFYEGKVKKGDAKKLRVMLEETFIQRISLNSAGGHAMEGFALGYLFKEYNMTAIVSEDNRCLSACANGVLGAPTKVIDGTLGFHVAWSSGKGSLSDGMKQGQQFAVIETLYMYKLGYGLYFQYLIATFTDSDTMLLMSADDLLLFKFTDSSNYLNSPDLSKGWIAARIAGPARMYLLGEGL